MPDARSRFAYASRRAAQEEVAAINACHAAAAAAHRRLARLHTAAALTALLNRM
jgi:hypothetical protein